MISFNWWVAFSRGVGLSLTWLAALRGLTEPSLSGGVAGGGVAKSGT